MVLKLMLMGVMLLLLSKKKKRSDICYFIVVFISFIIPLLLLSILFIILIFLLYILTLLKQARQTYKSAIEKGGKGYLLEEELPNVFCLSLGNISVGSNIIVKISYITELRVSQTILQLQLEAYVCF
jgi:hypothetical protein